jgi:hypothetical protein
VQEPSLSRAKLILEHAHFSARSLLAAFDSQVKSRGATGGATTDGEQDILRAMLVLATAGIDALAKQLITDAIPTLMQSNARVEQGLETFVSRQIRPESDGAMNSKLLAKMLVARDRRTFLIDQYVGDLTAGSLQSAEELIKVSFAMGIDPSDCGITQELLRPVFKARNQIIHELDINFLAPRRRRHSRTKTDMMRYTNLVLEVGDRLFYQTSLGVK